MRTLQLDGSMRLCLFWTLRKTELGSFLRGQLAQGYLLIGKWKKRHHLPVEPLIFSAPCRTR